MEAKVYLSTREVKAIDRMLEAFGVPHEHKDNYEINGPIHAYVNFTDNGAKIVVVYLEGFFCDVTDILVNNAGNIKAIATMAKGLFDLARGTMASISGQLTNAAMKYVSNERKAA